MKLKLLALTCILLCTTGEATPPRLGWEMGWCWDNVVIQLLYNMRGVTECLLKNAGECRKKNKILEKYIDLITAIRKKPDGYFIEEMRAYHAAFCEARGCTMCTSSFAGAELANFLSFYFSCCRDLFEMKMKRSSDKKEKVRWQLYIGSRDISGRSGLESVTELIARLKREVVISTMPQYLLLLVSQTDGVVNKYIDLAPLLSDELKRTGKTARYELIGVGIQASHVTAYIKDQWEDNPSWYYCDDMSARTLASHKKLDKWPESGPWPGKVALLVYKRAEKVPKQFAQQVRKTEKPGEGQDLEMLARALRDLAV